MQGHKSYEAKVCPPPSPSPWPHGRQGWWGLLLPLPGCAKGRTTVGEGKDGEASSLSLAAWKAGAARPPHLSPWPRGRQGRRWGKAGTTMGKAGGGGGERQEVAAARRKVRRRQREGSGVGRLSSKKTLKGGRGDFWVLGFCSRWWFFPLCFPRILSLLLGNRYMWHRCGWEALRKPNVP